MTAQYDITINKGSDFNFWFQYLEDDGIGIDLDTYSLEMQIKRYRGAELPLLYATGNGVTYGYTAGVSGGYSGQGSVSKNVSYDNTYLMGGIFINIEGDTTEQLPSGKYFYDVKIEKNTNKQRLLEGRISINDGVIP